MFMLNIFVNYRHRKLESRVYKYQAWNKIILMNVKCLDLLVDLKVRYTVILQFQIKFNYII